MDQDLRPKKKILFTSVLGPYGQDSKRSSYKNPMSLLANQVTRGQKYYTVQMAQRTFAYDLFAVNINADVAILDFPLEEELRSALLGEEWDRIGSSSIIPNFGALIDTCKMIRHHRPLTPVDIGGHIVNDDDVLKDFVLKFLEINPTEKFNVYYPQFEKSRAGVQDFNLWLKSIDAYGDGITFVRRDGLEYYSGLEGVGLVNKDCINAPLVDASFGKKLFGIPVPFTTAGLIIPDVGCPKGCNFCATSHKFDGKFVKFLSSAEDIMTVALGHESKGKTDFFVMSENFSLDTRRARNLLALMEEKKKPFTFSVFSSADSLVKLGIETIVKLGYTFIWIGLEESTGSSFKKMHGINLSELISELQAHGVDVLGSTILGFEHQKEEDLMNEIQHALKYNCVYNQFMLYMPVPGTALYQEVKGKGMLKENFPWKELHGQSKQNWHHPHIDEKRLEEILDLAFELDYEKLGPSLYRMISVQYQGYVNNAKWDHDLVEMRRKKLKSSFQTYIPILSAMEKDLKRERHQVHEKVSELKDNLMRELGMKSRLMNSRMLSMPLEMALRLEKRRYFLQVLNRKHPNPKTQLTVHGDLNLKIKGTQKNSRLDFVTIQKRQPLASCPSVCPSLDNNLISPLSE